MDDICTNLAGMYISTLLKPVLAPFSPIQLCAIAVLLLSCTLLAVYMKAKNKPNVYVLDFSVFDPPPGWGLHKNMIRWIANKDGRVLPEHVEFLCRVADRTGMGDETPVMPEAHLGDISLASFHMNRIEFQRTCLTTAEALFKKTGIKPNQVDFVITNSSLFNPTPSLSATVMNHFKMGPRTRGYSLGGMGCSAGVIALDLAKDLLQQHPNSYALIISHENISGATYAGRDPSMLIPNILFRCNGAAVLVTNKPRDARQAKYLIRDIVRTNMAADDEAFGCVQQTEDDEKILGVRLKRELISVGEKALRQNMEALGPVVLPLNEKLKYVASFAARKAAKGSKALGAVLPKSWTAQQYVPDFKKAFEYFCIHTGGRGIIDGLEKQMQLNRFQVEPSRATLYRFGNVSSTSVWYDLAYVEHFQGLHARDRVWQLAFGSGFKFNSSVLVANRTFKDDSGHPAWHKFDKEAMWVELDKLEAAARAGRAAKAARLAAEKAAAEKAACEQQSNKTSSGCDVHSTAACGKTDDVSPMKDQSKSTVEAVATENGKGVNVHVALKDDMQEVPSKALAAAVEGTLKVALKENGNGGVAVQIAAAM